MLQKMFGLMVGFGQILSGHYKNQCVVYFHNGHLQQVVGFGFLVQQGHGNQHQLVGRALDWAVNSLIGPVGRAHLVLPNVAAEAEQCLHITKLLRTPALLPWVPSSNS
jgi:hypothetical protein